MSPYGVGDMEITRTRPSNHHFFPGCGYGVHSLGVRRNNATILPSRGAAIPVVGDVAGRLIRGLRLFEHTFCKMQLTSMKLPLHMLVAVREKLSNKFRIMQGTDLGHRFTLLFVFSFLFNLQLSAR